MRKFTKGLGAATLAAATVVSGLSFGPAAATAAPAPLQSAAAATLVQSPNAIEDAFRPVWKTGDRFIALTGPSLSNNVRSFGSLAEAEAASIAFKYDAAKKRMTMLGGTQTMSAATQSSGGYIFEVAYVSSSAVHDVTFPNGEMTIWKNGVPWKAQGIIINHLGQPSLQLTSGAGLPIVSPAPNDNARALTARVDSVDQASRSARLSGTATKSADIFVGSTKIATANANGDWSGTVSGLSYGDNSITVVQKIGDKEIDRATVQATIPAPAGLTVNVDSIDHTARSARLSGTATKSAEIFVGSTKIATANSNGEWSGTVTGLNLGANSITVTQKVGGTVIDSKTVSVTIDNPASNGGLDRTGVGTTVTIPAGERRDVTFGLRANSLVDSMKGTEVNVSAAPGTTFANAPTTLRGEFKAPGGSWTPSSSLTLTGTVAPDEKSFTGTMSDTPGTFLLDAGYEIRWQLPVSAPADAKDASSNMAFQVMGTTDRGAYMVVGTSTVIVKAPVQEIAPPTVTTPANGATVTTSRPTFTGTGQPGASVTIGYGPQSIIGTGVVDAGGKWTINLKAGLALGTSHLKVVQTSGNNVQTVDHSVVRVAATVPFGVTSHSNNQTYTQGMATFRGTGAEGATIEAKNQWGTVMGNATVKNGQWSFNRNLGPTDNGYDITFTQTLNGEKSEVTLHLVYAGSLGLEVTSPANNSTYKEGLTTFTGKAMPNTDIVATNQWGTQMGKATTGLDGTWSFVRNLGPTTDGYDITFVATKGTDTQRTAIHLNPEFVNVPVAVTSIKDGATYRPGMNVLSGTGTPGGTVSAVNATNGWNVPMGTAKVDANGKWELPERNWGPSNDYEIKVTQVNPDKSTGSTTVKIKAPRFAPLVVSGYEIGAPNGAGVFATFTGTSSPFATVTIRSGASDTVYQTVEADENGNWSAKRTWSADHVYKLIFDQSAKDGQKDTVNYGEWTAE